MAYPRVVSVVVAVLGAESWSHDIQSHVDFQKRKLPSSFLCHQYKQTCLREESET